MNFEDNTSVSFTLSTPQVQCIMSAGFPVPIYDTGNIDLSLFEFEKRAIVKQGIIENFTKLGLLFILTATRS